MRGQGALEYLMTYGWALLVIVVVGAALYGLGVLNPSTYVSSSCTGFDYFAPQEHKMNANGNFSIFVHNAHLTIDFTNISIRIPGGTWTTGDAQYGVNSSVNPKGDASNVGPAALHMVGIYAPAYSGNEGDPYNFEIRITYRSRSTGTTYNEDIKCTGTYQAV